MSAAAILSMPTAIAAPSDAGASVPGAAPASTSEAGDVFAGLVAAEATTDAATGEAPTVDAGLTAAPTAQTAGQARSLLSAALAFTLRTQPAGEPAPEAEAANDLDGEAVSLPEIATDAKVDAIPVDAAPTAVEVANDAPATELEAPLPVLTAPVPTAVVTESTTATPTPPAASRDAATSATLPATPTTDAEAALPAPQSPGPSAAPTTTPSTAVTQAATEALAILGAGSTDLATRAETPASQPTVTTDPLAPALRQAEPATSAAPAAPSNAAVSGEASPMPAAATNEAAAEAAPSGSVAHAPPAGAVQVADAAPAAAPAQSQPQAAAPAPAQIAQTPSAQPAVNLSHLSRATVETTVQIAAQISRTLAGRSTRFEMGLTPEGLGRVDVSLEIDATGQLAARLAFDNPIAATEMRGRVDELRRELQDAGFTIARDGLEFADRQASSGGGFDRRQGRAFASAARVTADADLAQPAPVAWMSLSLTPRGVDVKV